jgi:serine/threonine protein kinase
MSKDYLFSDVVEKLKNFDNVKIRRERTSVVDNLSGCSFIKIYGKVYAMIPKHCTHSFIASGTGVLGKGGFGQVRLAIDQYGNQFAIKVERQNVCSPREVKINFDLGIGVNKKTMTRDYKTDFNPKDRSKSSNEVKYYTVQKYLGQQLYSYLLLHQSGAQKISDFERLDIALQTCQQVKKLHEGALSDKKQGYAHRDLKPYNITIDSEGKVHLVDFGLSTTRVDEIDKYPVGTPFYRPDLDVYRQYTNRELDMYALKLVLFHQDDHKGSVLTKQIVDNDPELRKLLSTHLDNRTTNIDVIINRLEKLHTLHKNKGVNPRTSIKMKRSHLTRRKPFVPRNPRSFLDNFRVKGTLPNGLDAREVVVLQTKYDVTVLSSISRHVNKLEELTNDQLQSLNCHIFRALASDQIESAVKCQISLFAKDQQLHFTPTMREKIWRFTTILLSVVGLFSVVGTYHASKSLSKGYRCGFFDVSHQRLDGLAKQINQEISSQGNQDFIISSH